MKEFDFEEIKSLYTFRYKLIKKKNGKIDQWEHLLKVFNNYQSDKIILTSTKDEKGSVMLEFLNMKNEVIAVLKGVDSE